MTGPPRETVALAGASPRALVIAKPSTRQLLIAATVVVAMVIPFALKSFFVFQLTLVMVYGLAILGLNLLTGFNGQFSLGHSAFYGSAPTPPRS
jgi:branched-chain amino acid transport system permease protein